MADLFDLLTLVFNFFQVADDATKKPTLFNVGCAIVLGILLLAACLVVFAASTAG